MPGFGRPSVIPEVWRGPKVGVVCAHSYHGGGLDISNTFLSDQITCCPAKSIVCLLTPQGIQMVGTTRDNELFIQVALRSRN